MPACVIQGQAAACTAKPPLGHSTFAEDKAKSACSPAPHGCLLRPTMGPMHLLGPPP